MRHQGSRFRSAPLPKHIKYLKREGVTRGGEDARMADVDGERAAAAARLGAKLPAGAVMDLLRHHDPQIRADACRFAHPWREAIPLLRDLLDDLHSDVGRAAACALGQMGRSEVRPLLARYLREKPSVEVIDAMAPLADEDCVILLGRVARAVPELSGTVLSALDAIDHPQAEKIANAIREKWPT